MTGSVTKLLNACRDDPEAWARLWARVGTEVARIHARATGRGTDPMDDPRFADALSRIFLEPRVWPSRAAFFAFLLRVLQNVVTDEHRRDTAAKRGGGVPHVPMPDEGVADDAASTAARTELVESLRALMERLKDEHPTAHAVLERKLAGTPWAVIAADLGLTAEAARAYWEFARAWVRREFDRLGG
jgi:DNA-directed RNA polymerase specialized sigma24 family protein